MKLVLVLACRATKEWADTDVRYAVIDLTEERIAKLRARKATFDRLRKKDEDLTSLEFSDPTHFFDYDNEACEEALPDENLRFLGDDFDPGEEYADTECDTMVINAQDVWWTCYDAGDVHIQTEPVPYEDLWAAIERSAAPASASAP